MKLLQIVPVLAWGDAIGNNAVIFDKVLKSNGFDTCIYSEDFDSRFSDIAKDIRLLPKLSNDDIVIYHLSFGTELNNILKKLNCHKILVYHNITPPEFFSVYSHEVEANVRQGIEDVKSLVPYVDECIAASKYNKQCLIEMGYDAERIWTMPGLFIPFEDYSKAPDINIINKFSDGWVNVLFVGRIVPNKRQDDVIRAFAWYKQHINPHSRLFLVGNDFSKDYTEVLKNYTEELGVQDVYFTGHISFKEIIAYYKCASVFLCMSEHEGFCVPLVEAMFFHVPIIAYNSTAIPDTLGGSGILLDTKNPVVVGKAIEKVCSDKIFRSLIIEGQNRRLRDFDQKKIEKDIMDYIDKFILKSRGSIDEFEVNKIKEESPANKKADIYIDITEFIKQNCITGIQRVVIEVTKRLIKSNPDRLHLLICDENKTLWLASNANFVNYYEYKSTSKSNIVTRKKIEFDDINPGDIYFELDATFGHPISRADYLCSLKKRGIRIVSYIYDIIPITNPQYTTSTIFDLFIPYLAAHLMYSDCILCSTKYTVDKIKELCDRYGIPVPETGVVPLGSDFTIETDANIEVQGEAKNIVLSGKKYILVVGTIEPRKNHKILIDAFDKGIKETELSIVFVGRIGWNVDDLITRIHQHEEYNKRIFILEGMNDASVSYLYDNAFLVANPSYIEGFGIPVIEGLKHHIPSIAADTPVFREVGGRYCDYFDPDNAEQLVHIVEHYASDKEYYKSKKHDIEKFNPYSWDQIVDLLKTYFDNISAKQTAIKDISECYSLSQMIRADVKKEQVNIDLENNAEPEELIKENLVRLRNLHVNYDRELTSKHQSVSKIVIFFKRVIRKLCRFLFEPMITEINEYHNQLNDILNEQIGIYEEMHSSVSDIEKRINADQIDDDKFYHGFEEKFRGSDEVIKERLESYIPDLKNKIADWKAKKFIDLGSGRGEWLDILRENGAGDITGVDLNEEQNSISRAKGHRVFCEDCNKYLSEQPDSSADLITAFQLIEHLPIKNLLELIEQCHRVLRPGGYMIFETPNPCNILVGSDTFYLDPTHKRPLDPRLVSYMAEYYGFEQIEIAWKNGNPAKLHLDNDSIDSEIQHDEDFDKIVISQINDINNLLYGAQDYAILACKIH